MIDVEFLRVSGLNPSFPSGEGAPHALDRGGAIYHACVPVVFGATDLIKVGNRAGLLVCFLSGVSVGGR